MQRISLDYNRF